MLLKQLALSKTLAKSFLLGLSITVIAMARGKSPGNVSLFSHPPHCLPAHKTEITKVDENTSEIEATTDSSPEAIPYIEYVDSSNRQLRHRSDIITEEETIFAIETRHNTDPIERNVEYNIFLPALLVPIACIFLCFCFGALGFKSKQMVKQAKLAAKNERDLNEFIA